jgi:hypothetical protein
MKLSCTPDPFEVLIKERLQRIHDERSGDLLSTTDWTFYVKEAVGELADSGSTPYSTAQPSGEWLYDLTILKQKPGGALLRCVLALESEWGTASQVSDDFQKLILCRADYRVIVFEARHPVTPEQQVEDLIVEAEEYEGSFTGDRYLFAAWVRGAAGFTFYTHIVQRAA